jgi:hypothetical protein
LLNQFAWLASIGAIESFEGPNEVDQDGQIATAAPFQQNLFQCAKAPAQGSAFDVVAASLAFVNPETTAALGNLSAWCDYGSLHSYAGGNPPSVPIPAQLALIAPVSGARPVMVTETGYHNAINSTPAAGQPGVKELAAAKYLLRTHLVNFAAGVRRTYTYELFDQGNETPALTIPDNHFGLVRTDGTRKPAFLALRNLLALLATADTGPTPELTSCAIEGGEVQALLLSHGTNRWLLFLWQEVNSYDLALQRDVYVPAVPVEIGFATKMLVEVYDPLSGVSTRPHFKRVLRTALMVPDYPLVVTISG